MGLVGEEVEVGAVFGRFAFGSSSGTISGASCRWRLERRVPSFEGLGLSLGLGFGFTFVGGPGEGEGLLSGGMEGWWMGSREVRERMCD